MNEVVINCNTVSSKVELMKLVYRELGFNDYLAVANLDGLYDLMAPDLYPELTQMTIRFQDWNTAVDNIRADNITQTQETFKELQEDWIRAGKTLDVAYIK